MEQDQSGSAIAQTSSQWFKSLDIKRGIVIVDGMAQPPQPNPSPKAKFLGIKHCVDSHRELLQRPDLATSLEQAFLQLQWELCGGNIQHPVDGNNAAARFYKLMGAHEFLRVFKTLAEVAVIPPAPPAGEIDHNSFK